MSRTSYGRLKRLSNAIGLPRRRHAEMRELQGRYESLTAREQEVMQQVVSGLLNKQVAAELKISEVTVKIHRGQVMRKMRADSWRTW